MSVRLTSLFNFVLLLMLTGCSSLFGQKGYFNQQKIAYLKSQNSVPLTLPPDVSSNAVGSDYSIPATVESSSSNKPVALVPPDSLADKIAAGKVSKDALKSSSNKVGAGIIKYLPPGNVMLQMAQPVGAIWQNLGSQLNLAGYHVLEQDRNLSLVFILDTKMTNGKISKATPIYQLHLYDADDGAQITVTDNSGKNLSTEIAQRVLGNLNDAYAGKIKKPPFKLNFKADKELKLIIKNLTGIGS